MKKEDYIYMHSIFCHIKIPVCYRYTVESILNLGWTPIVDYFEWIGFDDIYEDYDRNIYLLNYDGKINLPYAPLKLIENYISEGSYVYWQDYANNSWCNGFKKKEGSHYSEMETFGSFYGDCDDDGPAKFWLEDYYNKEGYRDVITRFLEENGYDFLEDPRKIKEHEK